MSEGNAPASNGPTQTKARWAVVVGIAGWPVGIVIWMVALFGAILLYLLMLPPEHVISNESAAVANLRTINTAQFTYQSSDGMGRFGTIPDLIAAELIDAGFGAIRGGYIFKVSVASDGKGYTATASPATNKNGKYAYYSTADAVIRYTAESVDTCDPCFPKGKSGQPVNIEH